MKEFIKRTETIIIYLGLLLTWFYGGFWAIVTIIVYTLYKVPVVWDKIKNWIKYLKS